MLNLMVNKNVPNPNKKIDKLQSRDINLINYYAVHNAIVLQL